MASVKGQRLPSLVDLPPKTECRCLHGGVIETVAHAIFSAHPMGCTCTSTYSTGVGAHTGLPSECSLEERYNLLINTTTTSNNFEVAVNTKMMSCCVGITFSHGKLLA